MNSLKACRFYERDCIGRLRELRWDEYLLTIDAMQNRPEHPYYQGRAVIKIDPPDTGAVEQSEQAE